ncbi:MAG: cell division protein ZapB [Janthinobacterium lividum]|uniref:Cell division protein ZapB n=1 Tax=Buchnera aphidicola (Cinara pseudotsugae) TaxID=2518978 RepID=A0A451DFU7_9GAMM
MVLEIFSNLEIKVQKSVDCILSLKKKIKNLKLKNKHLKEKLKDLYSLKKNIEEKNILIQEERIKWKNKLRSFLEKINDLE